MTCSKASRSPPSAPGSSSVDNSAQTGSPINDPPQQAVSQLLRAWHSDPPAHANAVPLLGRITHRLDPSSWVTPDRKMKSGTPPNESVPRLTLQTDGTEASNSTDHGEEHRSSPGRLGDRWRPAGRP